MSGDMTFKVREWGRRELDALPYGESGRAQLVAEYLEILRSPAERTHLFRTLVSMRCACRAGGDTAGEDHVTETAARLAAHVIANNGEEAV